MTEIFSGRPDGDAEIRRVELLFERLLPSVIAALVGIFLSCVVLFESIGLEVLKNWAAYMLTVLAVRIWMRYMFSKSDLRSAGIRHWEWTFAIGAFFTSVGWGALFGPLYPPAAHHDAQMFIMLLSLIVAFTGSVFLAVSNISFWLFTLPIMVPAVLQYTNGLGRQAQWPVTTAFCCLAVFVLIQRTLHRSTTGSIQRNAEAESLLAEQQAIFESSPTGIAVIEYKHVVKCNARLGELLGCRIQDLMAASLNQHFASAGEANKFLADRDEAFNKGHLAQGMYRLRRADGSQFWAEFSGRKMAGDPTHSVWMITDVTLRLAGDRRSAPRDRK